MRAAIRRACQMSDKQQHARIAAALMLGLGETAEFDDAGRARARLNPHHASADRVRKLGDTPFRISASSASSGM